METQQLIHLNADFFPSKVIFFFKPIRKKRKRGLLDVTANPIQSLSLSLSFSCSRFLSFSIFCLFPTHIHTLSHPCSHLFFSHPIFTSPSHTFYLSHSFSHKSKFFSHSKTQSFSQLYLTNFLLLNIFPITSLLCFSLFCKQAHIHPQARTHTHPGTRAHPHTHTHSLWLVRRLSDKSFPF